MQSEIKLHHPLFGNKQKALFTVSLALQLCDAFLLPNAIQLFVLILGLILVIFWR